MNRTPLKRKMPLRKVRPTLRRGELSKAEKTAIRRQVFDRAKGLCEIRLDGCLGGPLAWDGPDPWSHGHLVHLRAKRRFGWGLDNLVWGCWRCHLEGLHQKGRKPGVRSNNEMD
jgi:hypothetical protein